MSQSTNDFRRAVQEWRQKVVHAYHDVNQGGNLTVFFMKDAQHCTRLWRVDRGRRWEPKASSFFGDDFYIGTPFEFMISWDKSVSEIVSRKDLMGKDYCRTHLCYLLQQQINAIDCVLCT